jgi:hypothetical protein
MQKNKKKKRKRSKDSGSWPGYHHLDIITYEMATTISSHLPTDCLPTGILTAYSVQHQTRPDQTSANKKNKEIKKNKKKIKKLQHRVFPCGPPP